MFSKHHALTFLFISVLALGACGHERPAPPPAPQHDSTVIDLADPTIFYDGGTYYLYGTGGNTLGFLVYTSTDLRHWEGPAGVHDGYALIKGETYGQQGFWAPQVFRRGDRYYMAYTADEHIAIAVSDSPLGPFRQQTPKALSGPGKQIDPFIFFDPGGRIYLYHVRLDRGNRIFVAEMKPDLSDVLTATARECVSGTEPWENTAQSNWPVTEGPTVWLHESRYYLFYSANDFRNVDYAVGYATATDPMGPWTKFPGNPVISRQNVGHNGPGHGDLLQDARGNLHYVLHTHRSAQSVSPRLTGIMPVAFIPGASGDSISFDASAFRYLYTPKP